VRRSRLLTRSSLAEKKSSVQLNEKIETPEAKRKLIQAEDFTPDPKKKKLQSPEHGGQCC